MKGIMVLVLVVVMSFALLTTSSSAKQPNISCILVFGDSSVDPGNNNHLSTSFKANYAPYGKNFFHGHFTGRFSNGKLPTDFTAEDLGIETTVPGFLDPNLKKEDLLHGVSFASSASGYDYLTSKLTNVLPLAKQIEYFLHYKIHLKQLVGEEKSEEMVKNALLVISTGTNDFMQNYFIEPNRSAQYNVDQYTSFLTACMAQDIKEMHRLGARRLVVVGLPPLGCMPLAKTLSGSTECVRSFNEAALLLNSKIKTTLATLSKSLGMRIGYEDIYAIFKGAMKNPSKYGLKVTSKGCCGSGLIEIAQTCKGQNTCKHPSEYMFWDSVHPTEAMYKIISDNVVRLVKNYILA